MGKINFNKFNQQGFGLIEALVGMVVALIIILAFTTLISRAVVYNSINGKQLKATLYLQEMIEAAKDLEQSTTTWQSNWESTIGQSCASSTPCYLDISGSSWDLNSGTEDLESNTYERWLTIEDVYRKDADNEIIASPCTEPCTLDDHTKKVIAEIEWNDQLGSQRLELEAYLYNFNP